MKYAILAFLACSSSGCVSFGVECARQSDRAWVKVNRVGWGVSAKQAEALAAVKEKVCR